MTQFPPRKMQKPMVDHLSTSDLAQSTFEKSATPMCPQSEYKKNPYYYIAISGPWC